MNITKQTVLIIAIAVTILSTVSCKKVEILDSSENEYKPVVEAILSPEMQVRINIHEIFYFDDNSETNSPIENLQVYLQSNGKELQMNEIADSGIYYTDSMPVIAGETYKLRFVYKEKTIESSTVIPSKPDGFAISDDYIQVPRIEEGSFGFPSFVELELTWNNDANDYYMAEIRYMESTPDYINANMKDNDIKTVFYTEPVIGEAFQIQPMMISFFGTYRIILYHLTNDYAKLHENISNNSNNLTEPPTNIINGWGIFSGMNSDTLYLKVDEE